MPLTAEQEMYYKKCRHELERAKFFGSVPQYEAMMQAEVDRLEGESSEYKSGLSKAVLDDYHEENPFGEKAGSPNIQKTWAKAAQI